MPVYILILEDERIPRETIADEIRRGREFIPRRRSDPETAKRLIKEQTLDGAIVDLFFPKHGYAGLAVVEMIRQYNPNAYIEVVTGHETRVEDAIERGADRVLTKPLTFTDDLNRVGAGIARKRLNVLTQKYDLFPGMEIPARIIDEDWYMLINEFDILDEHLSVIKKHMRNRNEFSEAARELARDTIKRFSYHSTESVLETSADSELESDPNFLTLKNEYASLQEQHSGEFVAIYDGKIIKFADSFKELWGALNDLYSVDDLLIHQIR